MKYPAANVYMRNGARFVIGATVGEDEPERMYRYALGSGRDWFVTPESIPVVMYGDGPRTQWRFF